MAQIIVVEDDVYMREELIDVLEKAGYDAVPLLDFENAVSQIMSLSPDLILLDINLPFHSGFEICKEVKAKQLGTVLILTARDKLQDELHALGLGADDYLTKPCNTERLLARIKNLLRRKEEQMQQGLLNGGGFLLDPNTFTLYAGKELKDGGWDHLILTNPQWIDRFGDPSKLKPVEYGSLANSMQEFLDVQMPILTADGNVLPDGVGLYQYDGETLLAFPVHVALGAAEPIEAKNPLIILVDKPAQSLKASSCMLPLTSSGNVLFAEGEKLQESFDESKLIDYGSIEEFQMNH